MDKIESTRINASFIGARVRWRRLEHIRSCERTHSAHKKHTSYEQTDCGFLETGPIANKHVENNLKNVILDEIHRFFILKNVEEELNKKKHV